MVLGRWLCELCAHKEKQAQRATKFKRTGRIPRREENENDNQPTPS
jgi:hypothetical protein